MPSDALLTAEQVAEHVQLSVETIWRYTREQKLPAIRLGNQYRYRLNDVLDALTGNGSALPSRMTYEAFRALPEQAGLELIDHIAVKEPSPSYAHQSLVGYLFVALQLHVQKNDLGQVIVAPFDVVLEDDDTRHSLQPDVMFIGHDRTHRVQNDGLYGSPNLAIEVLSPATRAHDQGRKKELYLEFGCSELWLVDPENATVQQCVSTGNRWLESTHQRTETLEAVELAGFSLSLDELFLKNVP